nr:hypothetical protein [Brasilonema sp. UFV-L1]
MAFLINYLLTTCYFFINWLRFFIRHPSSSPDDHFLSFVMLIISTILWPITVPMSFLKILKTQKVEFNTVIPVLITVFTFSLTLYMG